MLANGLAGAVEAVRGECSFAVDVDGIVDDRQRAALSLEVFLRPARSLPDLGGKRQNKRVDQRAHFLTLATTDLDASRTFYVDGLGWTPLLDVPGEIVFFQIASGLVLGLFDAQKFTDDLGQDGGPASVVGLTLSHNVDSPDEVDAVVAAAVKAGATVIKQPRQAAFGGYHGHFADPSGVIWEVCHNPGFSVDADGTVRLSEL